MRLQEPVAMEMSETVYPTLIWQRKQTAYQVCGPPPSSWLHPNRVAYCFYSGHGRKSYVSVARSCPPQHFWVQPTCLLNIYPMSALPCSSQYLPAKESKGLSLNLWSNSWHLIYESLQFSEHTDFSYCISPTSQPCGVREKSNIIPISYSRQDRSFQVSEKEPVAVLLRQRPMLSLFGLWQVM